MVRAKRLELFLLRWKRSVLGPLTLRPRGRARRDRTDHGRCVGPSSPLGGLGSGRCGRNRTCSTRVWAEDLSKRTQRVAEAGFEPRDLRLMRPARTPGSSTPQLISFDVSNARRRAERVQDAAAIRFDPRRHSDLFAPCQPSSPRTCRIEEVERSGSLAGITRLRTARVSGNSDR